MSPMIVETLLNELGERGVRVRLKRFHDDKRNDIEPVLENIKPVLCGQISAEPVLKWNKTGSSTDRKVWLRVRKG